MPELRPGNPSGAIHPSLFLVLWAGLGALAYYIAPVGLPGAPWVAALGKACVLTAVILFTWSLIELMRHGTTMEHRKATTVLVTTGPFSRSRNPMYVALVLLLAGFAVEYDNAWWAVLAVAFAVLVHRFTVRREEAYLDRVFGADYSRYCDTVRRWL